MNISVDQIVYRMIEDVVGTVEAANIDLDLVGGAGTISVGDPAYDGTVTVDPDDTVRVWAQGEPRIERVVPGAWEHYQARCQW